MKNDFQKAITAGKLREVLTAQGTNSHKCIVARHYFTRRTETANC